MTIRSGDALILKVLGQHLWRARELAGFDRNAVGAVMGISGPAVANYDYGIRHIPFTAFLQYCFAIKTSPIHVMASVLNEIRSAAEVCIDLRALAADKRDHLAPLRKWARRKLASMPETQDGVLVRTGEQLDDMADVLGMDVSTLTEYLAEFAPLREIDDELGLCRMTD